MAPVLMLVLLLLAAALVWHDLGAREVLGRDENVTILHLDQPTLGDMLDSTQFTFTGQPSNMQPLDFLLLYLFWPAVGRSSFMLRFLPSAFGLLTVALTYKLGQFLSDDRVGLVGALLTALLPLHVRYAQIARPYSLLAALSLASACFLLLALESDRRVHWLGFVLTAALNIYNHFNALFVLAIEGLYVAVVWIIRVVASWRKGGPRTGLYKPVLAFILLGALCIPAALHLFSLPWFGSGAGVPAERGVNVELTVPFFRHYLYMSGVTTIAAQNIFFGLTVAGLLLTLYRQGWRPALLATLWLVVPFVTLALMMAPRRFEERYVIFVTPVVFLLAGQVVVAAGDAVGRLIRGRRARTAVWATITLFSLALAIPLAGRLRAYYAANRAADRLEQNLTVVEAHARPGDVVLVSPRFFARPLEVSGTEVIYLAQHLSPAEIDELAFGSDRLWLLCTSYVAPTAYQEPLDRWLQAHLDQFVRVPIKSVNTLAFGTVTAANEVTSLSERIPVLEDLARVAAGQAEAARRYTLLADTYAALGDLYRDRGDTERAQACWDRAAKIRVSITSP